MSDDFVPERHLGLWTEEGRSEWAALVGPFRVAGRNTENYSYGVTLERGGFNSGGKFVWRAELMLSWDMTTPEQAREEAAKAISRIVDNLLTIRAGLRLEPDEVKP